MRGSDREIRMSRRQRRVSPSVLIDKVDLSYPGDVCHGERLCSSWIASPLNLIVRSWISSEAVDEHKRRQIVSARRNFRAPNAALISLTLARLCERSKRILPEQFSTDFLCEKRYYRSFGNSNLLLPI